jgi:hypothetical protein
VAAFAGVLPAETCAVFADAFPAETCVIFVDALPAETCVIFADVLPAETRACVTTLAFLLFDAVPAVGINEPGGFLR